MHHLFCQLWRWCGSCERRSHHALTGGFMSIIWAVLPPLVVAEVHRSLLTLGFPPAVHMPGSSSIHIWLLLNLQVKVHLRSELINIAADGSIGTGPWAVGFERSHGAHRRIGHTLSNILVILRCGAGLLRPLAVGTSQLLLKPLPKLCQLLRGCRILASNSFLCWHRNRRHSTAHRFLRRLTGVWECCIEPFLKSEKPWMLLVETCRNRLWFYQISKPRTAASAPASTDDLFSFVDLPSISMRPDHCPRSYSTSTSAPPQPVPERLTVSLCRLYTSIFQKLICIFPSLFTMVCMVCMVCIASMVWYV